MTEHCVCAHCKLAAAEKEIERLRNQWAPYEHLVTMAKKLKEPTATYEKMIGVLVLDEVAYERRVDAIADLFFASQAVVNSIPHRV